MFHLLNAKELIQGGKQRDLFGFRYQCSWRKNIFEWHPTMLTLCLVSFGNNFATAQNQTHKKQKGALETSL